MIVDTIRKKEAAGVDRSSSSTQKVWKGYKAAKESFPVSQCYFMAIRRLDIVASAYTVLKKVSQKFLL